MKLSRQMQDWMRLGAAARLAEINAEQNGIYSAFPELRRATPAAGGTVRRQWHMSAEARKRQSERMKKYWAARRKAAAKNKK